MISRKRAAFWAIGGLALALLVSACSPGVSQEVADAKDREIATLKGQLTSVQQDATYWQQLNSVMMPVELKSMTDHSAYMLPSGVIMALHFDNMDLKQAKN
ncbi:MAG: hypothetical protein HY666_04165, partial [Chloroflexi bacterium]|nr:hypothetical protein [Chloroflexota bacterium]